MTDTTKLRALLEAWASTGLCEYPLATYALGLLDRLDAEEVSDDDEGQGPYFMAGRYAALRREVAELARALGLPATRAQKPVAGQSEGE